MSIIPPLLEYKYLDFDCSAYNEALRADSTYPVNEVNKVLVVNKIKQ